jgi:Ca-activated chloride channel family protein
MVGFALLGPEWGFHWREAGKGPDVIFAVDTSKSMLATDIQPNRLERCKLAITALLPEIQGRKVGLIAFAGGSFLQCPPIEDFQVFRSILDSLTVQSIPRGGTAVGTAIGLGRRSFATDAAGRKVLIILTDGENHEGDPLREARIAAREGIRIFTVGIGSPDGVLIPVSGSGESTVYLQDTHGKNVKTRLNERILKSIAAAAGGQYAHSSDIDLGLKKLYQDSIANRAGSGRKWIREPVNHFQLPLIIAIGLLVLECALGLFLKAGSLGG